MSKLIEFIFISLCISSISVNAAQISINYQVVDNDLDGDIDENGNKVVNIENSLKYINDNFNVMRVKLIEDQGNIFDGIRDNIEEYKYSRDYDLNMLNEQIANINNLYGSNSMNDLKLKKSEIEDSITNIQNIVMNENLELSNSMKITEEEYRNQLDKLNERKYHLTALMTQHCDECDDILRNYTVDINLAKVNQDIIELEQNFLKKAEDNEKKLKEMNSEKAGELIVKYSQLVDSLKIELDMYKKREVINEQKDKIIREWRDYAENIENLHINVKSKIQELTIVSMDVQKILTGYDDDVNPINHSSSPFMWVPFEENSMTLPENLVSGCTDIDGSPLYVIRKKKGTSYLYGKYAFSDARKNAYVTNAIKEFGISQFEILTATNYSWCETDSFDTHDLEYPVCKADHQGSMIPGTLLEDGRCRIGFEWGIKLVSDDFYVLTSNQCNFQQIQY